MYRFMKIKRNPDYQTTSYKQPDIKDLESFEETFQENKENFMSRVESMYADMFTYCYSPDIFEVMWGKLKEKYGDTDFNYKEIDSLTEFATEVVDNIFKNQNLDKLSDDLFNEVMNFACLRENFRQVSLEYLHKQRFKPKGLVRLFMNTEFTDALIGNEVVFDNVYNFMTYNRVPILTVDDIIKALEETQPKYIEFYQREFGYDYVGRTLNNIFDLTGEYVEEYPEYFTSTTFAANRFDNFRFVQIDLEPATVIRLYSELKEAGRHTRASEFFHEWFRKTDKEVSVEEAKSIKEIVQKDNTGDMKRTSTIDKLLEEPFVGVMDFGDILQDFVPFAESCGTQLIDLIWKKDFVGMLSDREKMTILGKVNSKNEDDTVTLGETDVGLEYVEEVMAEKDVGIDDVRIVASHSVALKWLENYEEEVVSPFIRGLSASGLTEFGTIDDNFWTFYRDWIKPIIDGVVIDEEYEASPEARNVSYVIRAMTRNKNGCSYENLKYALELMEEVEDINNSHIRTAFANTVEPIEKEVLMKYIKSINILEDIKNKETINLLIA